MSSDCTGRQVKVEVAQGWEGRPQTREPVRGSQAHGKHVSVRLFRVKPGTWKNLEDYVHREGGALLPWGPHCLGQGHA